MIKSFTGNDFLAVIAGAKKNGHDFKDNFDTPKKWVSIELSEIKPLPTLGEDCLAELTVIFKADLSDIVRYTNKDKILIKDLKNLLILRK